MKKALKILATALLVIIAAALCIWQGEIRTIASIEKVSESDPYLFKADYKASYDLDKVLAAGIDANTRLVEYVIGELSRGLYKPDLSGKQTGNGFACTSFQAKNANGTGFLFGRNYDFFKNPSLVLKTHPKDGYASISTCDLSHLGYSLEKLPESIATKALCLAAVYAPMDGMNEKGLCISIMALPKQAAWQDSGKPVAGTSILMRLILDRCATVDEAVEMVSGLDVRHDQTAGGGYHYLVADAEGNCAAIEFDLFDGWKTMITRKAEGENSMLMTNHLLAPKYYTTEPDPVLGNPHSKSWWRYETASAFLSERSGVLTSDEAQQCLADVHWKDLKWENGIVEDTQWSNVYDQTALVLKLRDWYDFDTTHEFSLD